MTVSMDKATVANLVKYDINEATLAAIKVKAETLTADTPEGYEEVRKTIAVLRDSRGVIEKKRVELKADALAFGRLVDSEAKRLTGLVVEIEDPLKAKKAAVDDEKERAKREAEAARLRAIEAEIEANRAKKAAEEKAVRDAEAARMAAEREALAVERARLAAIQAEIDAKQKAEQARIDAARKIEQDRIDAERARLAAERKVEEDRQRAERDKLEAERRAVEAERQKAERIEFERQARIRAEKEAAEQAERAKVEKAKRDAELAALLPDLDKLKALAAEIRLIQGPKVRSKKLVGFVFTAMSQLASIAETLETEAAAAKGGRK